MSPPSKRKRPKVPPAANDKSAARPDLPALDEHDWAKWAADHPPVWPRLEERQTDAPPRRRPRVGVETRAGEVLTIEPEHFDELREVIEAHNRTRSEAPLDLEVLTVTGDLHRLPLNDVVFFREAAGVVEGEPLSETAEHVPEVDSLNPLERFRRLWKLAHPGQSLPSPLEDDSFVHYLIGRAAEPQDSGHDTEHHEDLKDSAFFIVKNFGLEAASYVAADIWRVWQERMPRREPPERDLGAFLRGFRHAFRSPDGKLEYVRLPDGMLEYVAERLEAGTQAPYRSTGGRPPRTQVEQLAAELEGREIAREVARAWEANRSEGIPYPQRRAFAEVAEHRGMSRKTVERAFRRHQRGLDY